jgi:tRNA dimethylallyltransferase
VAAQGVGYSETIAHLEPGGPGLDRTIELIRARTRQFAKRQGTWFRGLSEVVPLPMEPGEPAGAVARRLADRIEAVADDPNPPD